MSVNGRIKQLRSESKLTMDLFGRKIGVGKTAISHIESGKANPSEQTIRSICREFGVREEWLRTGEGDMYEPKPTDLLDAMTAEYGFSEKERRVAEMFLTLDVARRRAALEYLSDVVDALNGEDAVRKAEVVPVLGDNSTTAFEPEESVEEEPYRTEEEIQEKLKTYEALLRGEQRMKRQFETERKLFGDGSETWTEPSVTGGKASSGSAG